MATAAERHPEQAANEGESTHLALGRGNGLLQLVPRHGTEDRDVAKVLLAEILDGMDRRVELGKGGDHSLHQCVPPSEGSG